MDSFCPLPWVHRFVEPTGTKLCCNSTRKLPVTVNQFENSNYLVNVKEIFSQNQTPEECAGCFTQEKQGLSSIRMSARQEWPGTNYSQVEYLDLRYVNLCNFSCRTCVPAFSSSIEKEIEQNPELSKFFNIPEQKLDYSNLIDQIRPYFYTLKKLNLTGGEPLLIKENLELLQTLVDLGLTHIQLLITTNASVINHKMLDLINQFDDVHWTLSIDAVGKRAEYIRYGSIWPKIEKNIHSILNLKHSVSINTTVSAYSVLCLGETVDWFSQLKQKYPLQPLEIMFHVVQRPVQLAPSVLPEQYLAVAREQISRSVELLAKIENNPAQELTNLVSLKKLLDNSSSQLTQTFFEFTDHLDRIRNQNFYEFFELEKINQNVCKN